MAPAKFSILNLLSAFAWAVATLALVAGFGATSLASFGLEGWKGALVVGLVLVALLNIPKYFLRQE